MAPRPSSSQPGLGGLEQEAADGQAAIEDVAEELFAGEHPREGDGVAGDDVQATLGSVGGRGERVDGRHFQGKLDAADAGEVDRQTEQVGTVRERGHGPGEGQREVEVVRRLLVIGKFHDHVFERQEHPWVDVQRKVQVERSTATLLGVQVHLPDLAQRIRLHEVALVVDVKAVIHGMVLQVGYVAGDVDGSHSATRLRGLEEPNHPAAFRGAGNVALMGETRHEPPREAEWLLPVLTSAARAVRLALEGVGPDALRRPGKRPGQYELDLVADRAACAVLHEAGLTVLSEESGQSGPDRADRADRPARAADDDLLVVVDPVDGSTNASLGIPWYATSLCVLDDEGPLLGVVVDQVSGSLFEAVRGQGAKKDGRALQPSGCTALSDAVVGISGYPGAQPGWAQFRALGAASLDMCAVAAGVLDGYRVVGGSRLFVWDYVAAMLICNEAGALVAEQDGQELVVRDASPRRPIAAATPSLLAELCAGAR